MATFTVNKNDLNIFDCVVTGRVQGNAIAALYDSAGAWQTRIDFADLQGPVNDSLWISAKVRHVKTPHGEAPSPGIVPKVIKIDADDYPSGTHAIPKTVVGVKHESHFDVLTVAGTVTVASFAGFDKIMGYTIYILAEHVTDAPKEIKRLSSASTKAYGADDFTKALVAPR